MRQPRGGGLAASNRNLLLLRRRRKRRKMPVKPPVAHACAFMRTGTVLEPFEEFSLIRFGARHGIRRICLEKSLNPRSRRVKGRAKVVAAIPKLTGRTDHETKTIGS